MKNKVSITIADETLAQLDWLMSEYLHCGFDVPLSQKIAMAVFTAYFDHFDK